MEGSARDWSRLPDDALMSIAGCFVDPQHFLSFRAVCPRWRRAVPLAAHARFEPWIVEGDEDNDSGNVLFSLVSEDYHLIHLPALEGMRVAGHGAGLLVGVDTDDELSAVLVNPLTGETTALPRLPERFRGTFTRAFATDPDTTTGGGGHVFVVVYSSPTPRAPLSTVALWRHGGDAAAAAAGWATMPSEMFWTLMPSRRSRLQTHGPRVLEGEVAAAVAGNGRAYGHMGWLPGVDGAHVIEHEGHVRVLVRLEDPPVAGDVPEASVSPGDPLPGLAFELRSTVGANGAVLDWANAPELRDKLMFQSQGDSCFVLLANDRFVIPAANGGFHGLGKNIVYFLSWQRQEQEAEDDGNGSSNPFGYYLCKWDVLERVATVVKKIPGVWERQKPGRWFLPTLKY